MEEKEEPLIENFENLGLTVKTVPKDGACAWHSLSWWFVRAAKSTTAPQALRSQTIDHMTKKSTAFEPLWDRIDPKGKPCTAWAKYLGMMRVADAGPGSWTSSLLLTSLRSPSSSFGQVPRPSRSAGGRALFGSCTAIIITSPSSRTPTPDTSLRGGSTWRRSILTTA